MPRARGEVLLGPLAVGILLVVEIAEYEAQAHHEQEIGDDGAQERGLHYFDPAILEGSDADLNPDVSAERVGRGASSTGAG